MLYTEDGASNISQLHGIKMCIKFAEAAEKQTAFCTEGICSNQHMITTAFLDFSQPVYAKNELSFRD
jgi:hypothetical protein